MNLYKCLSKVYTNAKVIQYNNESKFVIMSDCHRGSGNLGDNFLKNKNIFQAALNEYYKDGFTYIELGDGDELWENRYINQIIDMHSTTFDLLYKFYKDNRMYMIYGNHDIQKRNVDFLKCNYKECYSCEQNNFLELFNSIKVHESIILENEYNKEEKIFLIHGHQGDLINDKLWKLGRFLVRHVWRPLEMLGVNDPTKASKNYKKKNKVEKNLTTWSQDNNIILIAGHTHKPSFANLNESMYFNCGSCIHPDSITAIEIENGEISLVRWRIMVGEEGCIYDSIMYIGKEIIYGPMKLEYYFKNQ